MDGTLAQAQLGHSVFALCPTPLSLLSDDALAYGLLAPKGFVFRAQKLKAQLLQVNTGDGLFFFSLFFCQKEITFNNQSQPSPVLIV